MLFSFLALLILIIILLKVSSDQSIVAGSIPGNSTWNDKSSEKASRWKAQLNSKGFQENSAIFADSLAELYIKTRIYDSAAKYFEIAVNLESTTKRIQNAGNAYFYSFQVAGDAEQAEKAGTEALKYFNQLLEMGPDKTGLKLKSALILISGTNTSKGERLLNEVVRDEPQNTEALYHLGILAYQSGRYKEAEVWLQNVIEFENENVLAHYFLGVVYMQLGKKGDARKQLLVVKELDPGEETEANVSLLLEELSAN